MKKILVILFALVSAHAFGQAYSATVLQNSAGNYGRPVPYPQVLVCVSSDTNVPCISRATTYSDDTLSTQCTQTGSSGLLIGNPTSGPNCNNPGIGDVNGNFTIYVAGGEYTICTYSGTWLCQKQTIGNGGGSGSGGLINSCIGNSCDAYFPIKNIPSIFGDQFATDDGSGNKQAKSYKFTDPNHSGFWNEDAGPALPALADLHGIYFSINPAFGTTYGLEPWDNIPTPGDCVDLRAGDATNWIKLHDSGNPCGAGGATAPQALNPTAPTLANQNAAGARSITYGVQMCEDGPTCAFHSTLVTATIANANASPQVLLSAFADTLYGYRCANIYVTSDSGARTGVPGLIASCVWKKFIDTGANGNSIAATNTNTTVLDPNGSTNPLPGCNKIPASPYGIDGVPCTPTKYDWEGTETFGIGDAQDPFFSFINQGGATTGLTNGMLKLLAPTSTGDNWRMLTEATPATPWAFTASLNVPLINGTSGSGHFGICVYDGTKIMEMGVDQDGTLDVTEFANVTTGTLNVYNKQQQALSAWWYFQIKDDGTNLIFSYSLDGVNFAQAFSQPRLTFLANTNNIGMCVDNASNSTSAFADYDWFRRTL